MRPSISVSLEPGLERGVPWGRDLYTFVTSAAGHMMRTLQKPRKNRPSKRQVNHRRFLHNMIQRKFADIEAANHRLASAFQEEEKNESSPPSQFTLHHQSGCPSQGGYLQDPDRAHPDVDGISKSRSDVSVASHEPEISGKKQPDSGRLWKKHPKSQPTTCTDRRNNQRQNKESQSSSFMSSPKGIEYHHGAELRHTECYNDESQLNHLSEDSQTTQQDSGCIQLGQHVSISSSFSPELSPLSLDSCDFSIQMFTDISTQKSIADMSESQWTDIMDLFAVSGKDLGGCMDVEAYFENICACQGDAGQEVGVDDVGFADQSDSFSNRSEVEDVHCETGEYTYQYSCHGDQGLPLNHFQGGNEDAAETQFNNFKQIQETDIIQTHHSYQYNASELQTYQHPQEKSPCMLENCKNNQNFTPFERIAQSFSVPNPEHRPILTLPHEDDWLFTDILKDRKSPNFW